MRPPSARSLAGPWTTDNPIARGRATPDARTPHTVFDTFASPLCGIHPLRLIRKYLGRYTLSPPKSQRPLPLLILLRYPKYLGSYDQSCLDDLTVRLPQCATISRSRRSRRVCSARHSGLGGRSVKGTASSSRSVSRPRSVSPDLWRKQAAEKNPSASGALRVAAVLPGGSLALGTRRGSPASAGRTEPMQVPNTGQGCSLEQKESNRLPPGETA